jgi:hypothetical protein
MDLAHPRDISLDCPIPSLPPSSKGKGKGKGKKGKLILPKRPPFGTLLCRAGKDLKMMQLIDGLSDFNGLSGLRMKRSKTSMNLVALSGLI